MHNFDLKIDDVTKIEGSAALEIAVRDDKVEQVNFQITDYKRFFTQAMRGKAIAAVPQLLSRICGTCSNAHLLCSIESIEKALGITPSPQTMLLRHLTTYGLMIRDHTLHLGVFVLPDILGKDSIFELDENNVEERQLLEEILALKAAGNHLSILVAGRSVHAPNPTIGGFLQIPNNQAKVQMIKELEKVRPIALKLIKIFQGCTFKLEREMKYVALVGENFNFLEGKIQTSDGEVVEEQDFGTHLDRVVIPYSEASGYTFAGQAYVVGALARLNLAKDKLHPKTRNDAAEARTFFPSQNIFHNNLAQAVEVLHSIDMASDILQNTNFVAEKPQVFVAKESVGVGVVEAPRGTLYHKVEISAEGRIKFGQIVVPTGQNQISIEKDIGRLVQENVALGREKLEHEIEKLIRAYDPCMSCATHFLKVNWQ